MFIFSSMGMLSEHVTRKENVVFFFPVKVKKFDEAILLIFCSAFKLGLMCVNFLWKQTWFIFSSFGHFQWVCY